MFRRQVLQRVRIEQNRFGFEPEITAKIARLGVRVIERPIRYEARTHEEGKKIGWKDGLKALGVILYFWLIDDLYAQPYGRAFLNNMSGTPQYLSWIARLVRPHLGDTVLEIGAGIGNITARLMARRLRYVAAEKDPLYLHALGNRFLRTPNVEVRRFDPDNPDNQLGSGFDTVLCLNVLEYLDQPRPLVAVLGEAIKPGGDLVILVPQGPGLFGSVDRALGHKRRYSAAEIRRLLQDLGFEIRQVHQLNKAGKPAWWLFGKVLHRRHINKLTLKLFDKSVWLLRRLEWLLPWSGLSLVVVARRRG
jgi:SAM-dependent methyltransferase